MPRITPAGCMARALLCIAVLALVADAFAARPAETLSAGARVGVVNLLDPELTHYHGARQVQDGFLNTYTVDWPLSAMLLAAVAPRLTRLGLAPLAVEAGTDLRRARETCFLDAALAKGLPKSCAALYAQFASAQHLDALIVLGPGRNDSAHAGGTRRRELPEYLRGWCFVSAEGTAPPVLLNLSELLLIGVTPRGGALLGRAWGGNGHSWSGYQAPPDLKAIPAAQLEQLRALFAAMLNEQADALLTQLQVTR
jgi:hypothetical protein